MAEPNDRLIHYLSRARNCNPQEGSELVVEATADPQLYKFGELLSSPLAGLQGTHPQHFNLLRLFAHGSFKDYRSNKQNFPPLTPSHLQKLRILTLLTLSHSKSTLHYDTLLPSLDLDSVHALESVVIDAVYARLIRARIHQSTRTIDIAWAFGRDVTPESVALMRKSLTDWLARSTKLISEIEGRVNYIKAETSAAREARELAKGAADNGRQEVMFNR